MVAQIKLIISFHFLLFLQLEAKVASAVRQQDFAVAKLNTQIEVISFILWVFLNILFFYYLYGIIVGFGE